uniref:Uncharacterized protein n=1 Tax=Rhizophora mucronata TaxID=61149 RepID=A0A2P2P4V6_RHIMU
MVLYAAFINLTVKQSKLLDRLTEPFLNLHEELCYKVTLLDI